MLSRSSLRMDSFLSPFDTMFNFIPQGHEKALKYALYNALALLLMIICVSGVIAVVYILEPFIKPLLWAVLCGSVLYPLKKSLADILRRWLVELDRSSTPLVFGMMLGPIKVIDAMSEWALCAALYRWKLILGFISALIFLCGFYNCTPSLFLGFLEASFLTTLWIADTVVNFLSIPLVTVIMIAHLIAVGLWWYNTIEPRTKYFFLTSANIMWLITGGYLLGEGFLLRNESYKYLRTPAFLIYFLLLALGALSEIWERYSKNQETVVTGENNAANYSKWFFFLKGTVDEDSLENQNLEEEEEEIATIDPSKPLLKESNDSALSSHSSSVVVKEDKQAGKQQNIQKESKDSAVPESTHSPKKSNVEQNQPVTPKSSKRIQFDTQSLEEKRKVEENIADQETPVVFVKAPSQTSSSVSLRDQGVSRADARTREGVLIHPVLISNKACGSKCYLFPVQSQLGSNTRNYSEVEEEEDSNLMNSYNFIYGVMWACVFVQLFKNPWILQLLFLPLIVCLLHRTCRYFEVWSKICHQVEPLVVIVYTWYEPRQDALIPLAVKGLYKLMSKLNTQLTLVILGGVDGAASLVVMFGLITFGITALVFLAVQSYGESFHMLQVCGNVINSTIMNNPELSGYLPQGMETMVDNTLNNAYVYGREGLVSLIRGLIGTEENEAREHVEAQVLELWDRVYQAWVIGATNNGSQGPHVTDEAVLHSWENLLDSIKKTPGLTNFSAWSQFAQENVETAGSIFNSIWLLLKGNISLFITILTTLISVVFGGGSAVFGFLLSTIVFLTALYYLLNSSGEQYKPVEMITVLSPSYGRRIGNAFESAINGVFEASFKMVLFYGLWTWFVHNIFQMQIVYIPTALASLLAAIPFLGVYWASLPAVIDLWLSQGNGILALLIVLAVYLPSYVVDTIIYKEIKSGGHPYLTALSIAGGVFCLGVEGAIMGPMILCCFLVILNLSSDLFKDSTSETVVPVHLRRMRRMDTIM